MKQIEDISGKTAKGYRLFWLTFTLTALVLMFCSPVATEARSKRKSSEPSMRVKLGTLHANVEIKFTTTGKVLNSRGRRIRSIRAKSKFTWQLPKSRKSRSVKYDNETLTFIGSSGPVTFNGKKYRGKLVIKFSKKGALVINHLGIEDYLRGVVGSEMGSRSPEESLRAQTVIARTYSYSNNGKHGRDGADVCDSTHCQVYKGVASERESINKAVDFTRSIIMISGGKPIQTLYSATCGGMTSDNDKVFGGAACSYLRRVICPFCKDGSRYRWAKNLSISELKVGLAKEKIHFNKLYDVDFVSPGLMDRVKKVIFYTDKGEQSVKGTTFRRLFNLNSTTFTIGNRSSVKKLISSAAVVEAPKDKIKTSGLPKLRVMIADLGTQASDGPPQLLIQTAKGLTRVPRPEVGWKTITCTKTTIQVPEREEIKSSVSKNPAMKKTEELKSPKIPAKFEIFGRGYGHQVGLCQSGAIELGKRNWSYRQILPFYYSNVALRRLNY